MRVFLFLFVFVYNANAIELIRDAEIEEYLYDISSPIFRIAGIENDALNFYLVKDNSINAFVYGGVNIFVNTGLIENSNNPNMLQGVIAHELGHIMGAHLIKMQPQMSKALATYAIATLLGVGMLATDSSMSGTNAAIASTLLGQQIAERQFLAFSRSQEAEADRYALIFLQKSDTSTDGMIELFKKLEDVQKKFTKDVDKYSVTHPLSTQRLDYFKNNYITGKVTDDNLIKRHFFIQAKILAYSKNNTLYTNANFILNHPIYSKYYLAYKNILENNFNEAAKNIAYLLERFPENPFFHETAVLIFQKQQNLKMARHHFQKVINLAPKNLLFKHEFASFLIKNYDDEPSIKNGIFILETLKNTKETNVVLYQNLQFAYKKLNMNNYYLISKIEEKVLFEDTEKNAFRVEIQALFEKMEKILNENPNPVISQRLERIKNIYNKK